MWTQPTNPCIIFHTPNQFLPDHKYPLKIHSNCWYIRYWILQKCKRWERNRVPVNVSFCPFIIITVGSYDCGANWLNSLQPQTKVSNRADAVIVYIYAILESQVNRNRNTPCISLPQMIREFTFDVCQWSQCVKIQSVRCFRIIFKHNFR